METSPYAVLGFIGVIAVSLGLAPGSARAKIAWAIFFAAVFLSWEVAIGDLKFRKGWGFCPTVPEAAVAMWRLAPPAVCRPPPN